MAIKEKDVIKLTDVVERFNRDVWEKVKQDIGSKLYSNDIKPVKLVDDDPTMSSQGIPKFNSTAYIGINTRSLTTTIPVKNALPPEHLQSIDVDGDGNADNRFYFTLKWDDIAETESGTTIIAADLYTACVHVLKQLLFIRPLKSTWIHQSSEKNAQINETVNYFGIYKDSRDKDLEATKRVQGSQTYTVPIVDSTRHEIATMAGSYYEWSDYTKGSDLSIFSELTPEGQSASTYDVVKRSNWITGQTLYATYVQTEVDKFIKSWELKCNNNNRFTYTYNSCHLSCHSSCYCHGSRHRR